MGSEGTVISVALFFVIENMVLGKQNLAEQAVARKRGGWE
jgi:hypothetical protein